mmetsp:Transcript_8560/g.26564  ORF Transcript_8560/g.26564 Transcript_8560/m.26564 type:complete len:207 (+) Transcript_8560:143-763(+)
MWRSSSASDWWNSSRARTACVRVSATAAARWPPWWWPQMAFTRRHAVSSSTLSTRNLVTLGSSHSVGSPPCRVFNFRRTTPRSWCSHWDHVVSLALVGSVLNLPLAHHLHHLHLVPHRVPACPSLAVNTCGCGGPTFATMRSCLVSSWRHCRCGLAASCWSRTSPSRFARPCSSPARSCARRSTTSPACPSGTAGAPCCWATPPTP